MLLYLLFINLDAQTTNNLIITIFVVYLGNGLLALNLKSFDSEKNNPRKY